ncbi:MAG: HAMP domain-containing protein [Clostridia bacterium]|nr:HAMP domain-containing protein [Clostridia bacterium]
MFKSIQTKLVLLFILVILSVMLTVGTFIITNVTRFYYTDFMSQIGTAVFTEEFVPQLTEAAESQDGDERLSELLEAASGRIGVDSYRNYAILDAKDGKLIAASDELLTQVEITDNILAAMSGRVGDTVVENGTYMEYAYPVMVENEPTYVIYVYETKEELTSFSRSMFLVILQALVVALLISVVLGYLLSKTITKPIKNLTSRAQKIADGEFEVGEGSPSKDEIGVLTNTFKTMGQRLSETVQEVASQNTKLEKIMEYSTDGIVAFDTEGELLHINPSARKYLALGEDETIRFDEFFTPIFSDISLGNFLYLNPDKQLIKEGDYNNYYLRFYFGSFRYSDDTIGGVIVDVANMTESRKLELSRREFVANVSHELRTPLTTVKAYIETLESGAVDGEMQEKFLDTIHRETDRMTRLVSDLLILSRLDNGVKLNLTRMHVESILKDVAEKMQFEAKKKHQVLTYTPINEIPEIALDYDRMQQVIINIVSNAIKYTPTYGAVKIYSSYVSDNAIIRIVDNGMGIPEKDVKRIFERFYRVDKARSREQGGTGLGLAIAKEIVNAHAGEITLHSKLNEGTEVVITLPVEKSFRTHSEESEKTEESIAGEETEESATEHE